MHIKIGILIAHNGFRDEEYWVPKKMFEESSCQIITISSKKTPAISKFKETTPVDIVIGDLNMDEIKSLVIVGGPGTQEYFDNLLVHKLARETLEKNKILAAICIAPVILARAGLLAGKKATVFPTGREELEKADAKYVDEAVVSEGNIITANGPQAAQSFAERILSRLF